MESHPAGVVVTTASFDITLADSDEAARDS